MTNIYHVSPTKRKDGDAGGVPKFGWYMERAVNSISIIPSEINQIKFNEGDIIIGDGYFVEGFDTKRFKVISIIHGSWKEYWFRNDYPSFLIGEIDRQNKVWSNHSIIKIAVSESAKQYAEIHHNIKVDKIILNSIDTDLFVPIPHSNNKPIVIYPCQLTDYNKANKGLLGKIIERLSDKFQFEFLNARIGEEHTKMARGDIYLSPSRFEGNSYASLEAMSCGLIPVVSNVGLFEFTDFGCKIAEIIDRNADVDIWCNAITETWRNKDKYSPREWVVKHANFNKFKQEWLEFLESLT